MTSSSPDGRLVTFQALDGYSLAGTLFEPEEKARAVLLVNSGTGIPRRFYTKFAQQASRRGFAVLTYDYRGIGGSAPDSLRGYEAAYRHWGRFDVAGAIAWADEHYPDLPLTVVGHSTGGQQLGLAENVARVRAAVFIAVSTGYWGGMPSPFKWFTLGLWKVYLPIASRIYGYAPVKKIGWGENLPTGVAREWGAWCLEPDYLAAYFDGTGRRNPLDGEPFGPIFFNRASLPILAYGFTDDPIATPDNVPPMLGLFDRADITVRWVEPEHLEVPEVGHIGFFRAEIGAPLWDEALDWLLGQVFDELDR